ncbi:unnamed protein product, partial [Ranitomeya imitator]
METVRYKIQVTWALAGVRYTALKPIEGLQTDKVRLRWSRSVTTRRGRHRYIGGLSTALQNVVDKTLMLFLTMDQEILEKMCHLIWEIHRSPELRALSPSTTHPTAFQYFNFTLSIFTCVMGFVANIIVIIVTGFLLKKNKYKIWFLNLAVADFTFILILPFSAVSEIRGKWLYGSSECKFFNFLGFVNTYASIYILTVLNIDRALSVAKPIWHRSFHSQKFCCFMCTFIWLSSALCSIPAIIYSDVYEENQCTLSYYDTSLVAYELSYRSENESLDDSLEMCENISDLETSERRKLVADWREMTFTTECLVLPLAVVGYCIPLCLIVSSNIIIAFHVKNSTMAASSRLYRL